MCVVVVVAVVVVAFKRICCLLKGGGSTNGPLFISYCKEKGGYSYGVWCLWGMGAVCCLLLTSSFLRVCTRATREIDLCLAYAINEEQEDKSVMVVVS